MSARTTTPATATTATPGPLIDPSILPFMLLAAGFLSTNPFSPQWMDRVKKIVGRQILDGPPVWCSRSTGRDQIQRLLVDLLARNVADVAERLEAGTPATPEELSVYERCAFLCLYARFGAQLQGIAEAEAVDVPFYDEYVKAYGEVFPKGRGLDPPPPERLIEILYQVRRAWYYPWSLIHGAAPSMARARAAIWEASVAKDLVAYYREGLWKTMDEQPVLITGETGTGKELAARCIGGSRPIPFDKKGKQFARAPFADYHVVNLADTSPTLFESQFFGHKRGSFTGATEDLTGYIGLPGEGGTLVCDEFGEISREVQSKLLRPMESGEYRVIGDSVPRRFKGRFVISTNKDLTAMVRKDTFRSDLHARVNVLRVHMPPLRRQLEEAPDERRHYVRVFVGESVTGSDASLDRRAAGIEAAIARDLPTHRWPENLRELKHYVRRSILSTSEGEPVERRRESMRAPASGPAPESARGPASRRGPGSERLQDADVLAALVAWILESGLSLDDVNRHIVTAIYDKMGRNQKETARRLKVNWRTAGERIDHALLAEWDARRPR